MEVSQLGLLPKPLSKTHGLCLLHLELSRLEKKLSKRNPNMFTFLYLPYFYVPTLSVSASERMMSRKSKINLQNVLWGYKTTSWAGAGASDHTHRDRAQLCRLLEM